MTMVFPSFIHRITKWLGLNNDEQFLLLVDLGEPGVEPFEVDLHSLIRHVEGPAKLILSPVRK